MAILPSENPRIVKYSLVATLRSAHLWLVGYWLLSREVFYDSWILSWQNRCSTPTYFSKQKPTRNNFFRQCSFYWSYFGLLFGRTCHVVPGTKRCNFMLYHSMLLVRLLDHWMCRQLFDACCWTVLDRCRTWHDPNHTQRVYRRGDKSWIPGCLGRLAQSLLPIGHFYHLCNWALAGLEPTGFHL
jgi:hypothetical protein